MASLQQINGVFYIRFRFGGMPFRRSLGTDNPQDAESLLKQVEVNLHRINVGIIPIPPAEADVIHYVLTGGKECGKPNLVATSRTTLEALFEDYFTALPDGAKEANSLATERTHVGHLLRLLKGTTNVAAITTVRLQDYINQRAKESGQRGTIKAQTIKKEIATLRNIWNNFAQPRKLVVQDFRQAFGKLTYPKDQERPQFQTWEQIERQVKRGKLPKLAEEKLWDCLFLDIARIRQVLDHVRQQSQLPPWVYPAFVAAAYTGCRRGEIMRSEWTDWDIDDGTPMPLVQWRQKKQDRSREFTYRQVSVTPLLQRVMNEWRSRHPGGTHVFCNKDGSPLSPDEAMRAFEQAVAGSPWIVLRGWHVFRHSFISCMAMKGVDQRIIDASVGHQTDEMRRRYRHLFPQKQHEVLAAVFAEGQ
jgi:integrase